MKATLFNMSYENFLEESKKKEKRKIWTDIEIIDNKIIIYVWDFGDTRKSFVLSHYTQGSKQKRIVSRAEYKHIGADIHKNIFVLEDVSLDERMIRLDVYEDWTCVQALLWSYNSDKRVFAIEKRDDHLNN